MNFSLVHVNVHLVDKNVIFIDTCVFRTA